MQESDSRGGAKPDMFRGGSPLIITINNNPRKDWYELNRDKTLLARRVELPTWLSDTARTIKSDRTSGKSLLSELCSNSIKNSAIGIGESKGHILIEALQYTKQNIPCVGLDIEIIDQIKSNLPETIHFYVYYAGYELCERWSISWKDFDEKAIEVEAKPPFMPQKMIPVTHLRLDFIGR
jgi:hypothetical protein